MGGIVYVVWPAVKLNKDEVWVWLNRLHRYSFCKYIRWSCLWKFWYHLGGATCTIIQHIIHINHDAKAVRSSYPQRSDKVPSRSASKHKRSGNDRKPLPHAQVSATTGRHIGHEPRDELEFVGATSVHETHAPPVETPDTPRTKTAKYIQRTLDEGYSRIQQANYHDSLLHVAHSTPARPRVIPRTPKLTLVLPMLDATYFCSQPAADPNLT
jgi:hypothetical protein